MENREQKNGSFRFNDLPPELRTLVWEFSIPQRLFHVRSILPERNPDDEDNQEETQDEMFFKFFIDPPSPAALRVCRESRAVATRHGFFFRSSPGKRGPWFNPPTDVLYIDRGQRHYFRSGGRRTPLRIAGAERVLNVGIEWRAFFHDVSPSWSWDEMPGIWRRAISPVYLHFPNLQAIHYILPQVRFLGGAVWGRVPFGSVALEPVLVPLPANVNIPWDARRNVRRPPGMPVRPGQPRILPLTLVRPWCEVKREMELGVKDGITLPVEEEDGPGSADHAQRSYDPPEIVGWWLLRKGTPGGYGDDMIREFKE